MSAITFLFITLQALALVSRSYQECGDIDPPEHGTVHHGIVQFQYTYSFYQVSCDPGYILHGVGVVYCVNNEWASPPPRCVGIFIAENVCEELSAPENGQVKCDEGPLSASKACRFECNDGYRLNGFAVRRCLSDLSWSGTMATCMPLESTYCSIPPPLTHGTVIGCSPANPPSVGKRCNFYCNQGYFLSGPAFLTCKLTGKLADAKGEENFPKCVEAIRSVQNSDNIPAERVHGNPSKAVPNTYDPCNNHQCEQLCRIEKGRAQCRCDRGYILNRDQRTCRKNNCDVNKGGCAHFCTPRRGGGVLCTCRSGYVIESDGKSCKESTGQPKPTFNACIENNGGCEHFCSITRQLDVLCSCRPDYKLDTDHRSCIKKISTPVRRPPYRHGTQTPAFTQRPIPVSPCTENNGGCEHTCDFWGSVMQCSCRRGYTLHPDQKHCIDIDECSSENLNNCQHYCSNTEGGYKCYCKPGYILMDGYKCEGCGKNSYLSHEFQGCVDCPKNSHTISEGATTVSDCSCDSGYAGSPRDGIICADVNECRTKNFGCSDSCVNIPGSAYCSCPEGFMLDKDNRTCVDIDECSIKNGGCEGNCQNLVGSFRCSCPEGYTSSNKDHYSCDDVDECLVDNGDCEQKCVNYRGGYYCACEDGFRLDRGLKNCTDIQCPILPVPPYSNMICKKDGEKFEEMDHYPTGTICNFKCNTGFKNYKSFNRMERMECQQDGSWKGTLPECKPQQCDPLQVPENGDVHPSTCSTRGTTVKQKCTFTCRPGYVLKGNSIFHCKNNLTWNIEEIPVCQPEKIQPRIECPPDITATLLLGKNTQNITVPEPTTNMESFTVQPREISTGTPTEFQVGVTRITFTAASPNSNKTAKCVTTVTVLDKEPPVFDFCPDPIEIEGAGAMGEFVTWKEPVVTDNVEVELLLSSLEPNVTLSPGTHVAVYIARDTSGNTAECSFDINVIRINCSDLIDPAHGEANCADWIFGKLCQPQCDAGYMRNPDDPLYYSCDDTGIWEPSDVIYDCLQFIPATSATCPDGFELKTDDETSQEVCVECPSGSVWSVATKQCEETTI